MGLNKCRLFTGISQDRIEPLLSELKAISKKYGEGQIILAQGERTDRLGVVKKGSINALRYSSDGKASLISHHTEGKIFADFLAATGTKESPVTITAGKSCEVVFIPMSALFSPLKRYETEGRRLLANLAAVYAEEYFVLQERIYCLTGHTLRDKILRLLSLHSKKTGKSTFSLPYGRDRMAAELNAERSALCRELSRMREDGIIEYKGKVFSLIKA